MDPFIGQIIMFGGNFAPRGWAYCDGQLLPIDQNTALFSLMGTIYGGDGRTTFALPDLRGRSPVGPRSGPGLRNVRQGEKGGREVHTLSVNEMPSHSHEATLHAELTEAHSNNPKNKLLAAPKADDYIYAKPIAKDNVPMDSGSIKVQNSGGNQSFSLHDPYIGINFIIALEGVYPARN